MKTLMLRLIKQLVHDKRTIIILIIAPVLVITLIYLLLSDSGYVPKVAIVKDSMPATFITELEKQDLNISTIYTEDFSDWKTYLRANKDVDLLINGVEKEINIYALESNTANEKATACIINASTPLNTSPIIETHFVYGDEKKDTSLFDNLGYIFLGFFPFFFIFVLSGMSFVRERNGGTLERLMMTPIRKISIILGYIAGFSLFAIVQAAIIVIYTVYFLKLPNAGSVILILISVLLLSITALSLGLLISTLATSEFQIVQFIPIIIIPQVFFSGLLPLQTMPFGLGNLCYIMPIYYGCNALKKVMIYGDNLTNIGFELVVLIFMIILLSTINIFALKKYRV